MNFSSLFYPVTVQTLPVTLTNFRQGLEWDNLLTLVQNSTGAWNSQTTNVQTLSVDLNNFRTEVGSATATLLPTTVYQNASGAFVTVTLVDNLTSQLVHSTNFDNYKTEVGSATATLLPTTVYQNASGGFTTNVQVNNLSSLLVLNTDFNSYKTEVGSATATLVESVDFDNYKTEVGSATATLVESVDFDNYKTEVGSATATLVRTTDFNSYKTEVGSATATLVRTTDFNSYKTEVGSATATLLPTTVYQNASGNWQGTFTLFQNNSATYILDGGNNRTSNLLVGTNDNFHLNLETGGTTRVTVFSSGNVGIGTTVPNALLTVAGQISSNNVIFALNGNSDSWNSVFTNVQTNSAGWVEPLRRFDFIANSPATGASTTYTGVAVQGTATTSEAWKITRIIFTTTGSVSSNQVRENVAWSMRTSLQYFNP